MITRLGIVHTVALKQNRSDVSQWRSTYWDNLRFNMLKIKDLSTSKSVWLVGAKMSVGSATNNDLIISGEGACPNHAVILIDGDNLSLSIIERNPTKINDKLVVGEQPLNLNDTIYFGSSAFQIIDPKQEVVEAKAAPQAQGEQPQQATQGSGWILQGDAQLKNRQYPINDKMVLGRSPDCDLSFSFDQLSRQHVTFKILKGDLFVKDMGSSNGTHVNGRKVDQVKLNGGDTLSFGPLSFNVIAPSDVPDETLFAGADLGQTVIHSPVDTQQFAKALEQKKAAQPVKKAVPEQAPLDTESGLNMGKVIGLIAILGAVAGAVYFLLNQ